MIGISAEHVIPAKAGIHDVNTGMDRVTERSRRLFQLSKRDSGFRRNDGFRGDDDSRFDGRGDLPRGGFLLSWRS
ncbi:MAG: hypothetical protein LHV69_04940 [Elusimicrobia bacterium]|nr:hypothetical protein [Candidatus Obscuribacterium magneticum]MCB4756369.1 hypothetical protein [Candidatus Obscuribacterium magneticum]